MSKQLLTVWGEKLKTSNVLQEYPRPQMQRDSYINLNGMWKYAINKSPNEVCDYDGEIVVPFSPESMLSAVNRMVMPVDFLHYYRDITIPSSFNVGRVLLHFGAVDMFCKVYVNGKEAGSNEGGYYSFTLDITSLVKAGQNSIALTVWDYSDTGYYTRGKQKIQRGGMWYTPQSGIWQTVWLESVPEEYIKGLRITPDLDSSSVKIEVEGAKPLSAEVFDNGKFVAKGDFDGNEVSIVIPNCKSWSPESPFLYDVVVKSATDSVKSYFGMRKFSLKRDSKGHMRIMLNNCPYFMNGLLDQGYWSDGLYTAPDDQAMIYDIRKMKDLGFNMLRKHIKIEPMRWYYHCDRLGMLVWQDMPSGGLEVGKVVAQSPLVLGSFLKDNKYKLFGRQAEEGRKLYNIEYKRMIDQLYNVPCICAWVPFNEAWGQFDAKQVADWTKAYDPTRLVDHASGWHDQKAGDFLSKHIYFRPVKGFNGKERAYVVSEFGGYGYKDDKHSFNDDSTYGYNVYPNVVEFFNAYKKLYERQILPLLEKGLCATVYTQVSDVEDEINGLLTYDRRVCKVEEEATRGINAKLHY